MKITATPILGLVRIEPRIFQDPRGSFFESFNETDFQNAGLPTRFAQDNLSRSKEGTVRGLHFQKPPHAQGKLVRVLEGTVFDVTVDLRKSSSTFGHWHGEILSAENALALFIPPGCAHGFCVTSQTALFFYKCTTPYEPHFEDGIFWRDPTLNISWPLSIDACLNEKDRHLPPFRPSTSPFDHQTYPPSF